MSRANAAPRLSVIVPAYNAEARLEATLWAIGEDAARSEFGVEVIVVDDGSADGTRATVERAREAIGTLEYVFRPRDSGSGRATARNLGLALARAARVLFLDAGVLPGPGLLSAAATLDSGTLAVFKTLGLFAAPRTLPRSRATWAGLLSSLETLCRQHEWRDLREAHFNGCGAAAAAPWLLAWTCALAAERSAVSAVGGFDASYVGWGAEDIDLAARLAHRGVLQRWVDTPMALHLPHSRSESRAVEHAVNARKLHQKLGTRESELFSIWKDGFAVNAFAARLDALNLHQVVAPSPARIDRRVAMEAGRMLCLGLRWERDLLPRVPDVALVHEASAAERLRGWWPSCDVRCLIGAALPFEDGCFAQALIGDFLRLLPRSLQAPLLAEMLRVARRVALFFGPVAGAERVYREIWGWPFSTPAELVAVARAASADVLQHRTLEDGGALIELTASRAPRPQALYSMNGGAQP